MKNISLTEAEKLYADNMDALYEELLDGVLFNHYVKVECGLLQAFNPIDVSSTDTCELYDAIRARKDLPPIVRTIAMELISLAESLDVNVWPVDLTGSNGTYVVKVHKSSEPSHTVVLDSGESVTFTLQEMSIRGVYGHAN